MLSVFQNMFSQISVFWGEIYFHGGGKTVKKEFNFKVH